MAMTRTRLQVGLLLVLMCAALTLGIHAFRAVTTTAARPVITPAAQAAATPPSAAMVWDIAVAPPSLTLEGPLGKSFWIEIAGLAPAARYRLTVEDSAHPRRTREREEAKGFLAPEPAAPPCDALAREIGALVKTSDEAAVAARVASLRELGSNDACGELTMRAKVALQFVSQRESVLLLPGRSFAVKVERLSLANGEAERTWTLQVQGRTAKLAWPSANETSWVVESVARDIVEMAWYAKGRSMPSVPVDAEFRGGANAESIVVRGPLILEQPFRLEPYVWAPSSFRPLAERALAGVGLAGTAPASLPDSALPKRLLDARLATVEQENQRISLRLAENMRDAEAHEAAALILGALSLRESRGPYGDVRPLLSRLCAHLAMALALRGDHRWGAQGRVAEAALLALSGRGAHAMKVLALLGGDAQPDESLASWLAALRLRATADHRLARPWDTASALERIEIFRARVASLSVGEALALLDERDPEPLPDWGRLAMSEASVEAANRFAPNAVGVELGEAQQVMKVLPSEIVAALKLPPERCVSLREGEPSVAVIGRGQWAAFFGRQIIGAADASFAAAVDWLGLPDAAKSLESSFDQHLERLSLFPLLKGRMAEMREGPPSEGGSASAKVDDGSCDAMEPLLTSQPHLVTYALWRDYDRLCRTGTRVGSPQADRWFTEPLLAGTAFDASNRLRGPFFQALQAKGASSLRPLRELSPYEPWVRHAYARAAATDAASAGRWLELHEPLSDYSLTTLRVIASWVEDQGLNDRLPVLRRMCNLQEEACFELGESLAGAGRDDEAAGVLRKAFAAARDVVTASHYADWLVDYELRKGRTEQALAVARAAAETYSSAGLRTYARLLERLRRFDEAREQYEAIRERYNETQPLEQFAVRAFFSRGDARYESLAEAAVARDFPYGLERISRAELTAPPYQGVLILDETAEGRRVGIHQDDIVVAIDGYRVRTHQQYMTVRAFKVDPHVEWIVWRDGRYFEVAAELPGRSFGSKFTQWTAQGRRPE
jgi:hypothetical protein